MAKRIKLLKDENKNSIGHVCVCGKKIEWPGYVFAHYHNEITHTCDCGSKVLIHNGSVRLED